MFRFSEQHVFHKTEVTAKFEINTIVFSECAVYNFLAKPTDDDDDGEQNTRDYQKSDRYRSSY